MSSTNWSDTDPTAVAGAKAPPGARSATRTELPSTVATRARPSGATCSDGVESRRESPIRTGAPNGPAGGAIAAETGKRTGGASRSKTVVRMNASPVAAIAGKMPPIRSDASPMSSAGMKRAPARRRATRKREVMAARPERRASFRAGAGVATEGHSEPPKVTSGPSRSASRVAPMKRTPFAVRVKSSPGVPLAPPQSGSPFSVSGVSSPRGAAEAGAARV